jgi:hypothetical protein
MTNPRFKGMKNNPHDKKAKKVLPEPIVKAAKSADAQQWNQGHYNNQICIGLDGVHSNNMHPYEGFQRSLRRRS